LEFGNAFYCEAFRPGPIKQPANTLSNFGFILMGLWLATRAKNWRAASFATVIAFLGPGSMALHAGMTSLGGGIDVASMFLFIGFALLIDAARLNPFVEARFSTAAAAGAAGLFALGVRFHRHGIPMFAWLITLFVAAEVFVRLKGGGPARDRRLLALASAFFFTGYVCWKLSEKSTGPWCWPTSPFQGHAFWHLFSALAAGTIYLYLEPEFCKIRL
jgi:hypothetical protein